MCQILHDFRSVVMRLHVNQVAESLMSLQKVHIVHLFHQMQNCQVHWNDTSPTELHQPLQLNNISVFQVTNERLSQSKILTPLQSSGPCLLLRQDFTHYFSATERSAGRQQQLDFRKRMCKELCCNTFNPQQLWVLLTCAGLCTTV